MTIEKALKILDKDREFLGMDWYPYFAFIRKSPGAFSTTVIEAFERYTLEVA